MTTQALRFAARMAEIGRRYPRAGVAYLTRSARVDYLPTHVWIEPTNYCDLDCVMCPSGMIPSKQRGFLDVGLLRKCMAELSEARPTVFLHMGGEPLLHPKIDELVRVVREYGGSPSFFTNAVTLDEDKGNRLIDAGLDWLGFSFDGYNAATYERIRRRGRFREVLGNIQGFLELKRRRGVSHPYTHLSLVRLPEVLEGSTPAERAELKAMLKDLGLNRFDEVAPHSWSGTFVEIGRRRPSSGFAVCPSPWTSLVILWDGTVVPCCYDMLRRHPVGDATKQTLLEIMTGPKLTELRERLGRGRFGEVELCSGCEVPRGRSVLGVSEKVLEELLEIVRTFLPHG